MLAKMALVLTVLGWLLGTGTCRADDAAEVLRSCRMSLGTLHCGQVTLERQGGTWRVAGVDASFQNLSDGDVARLIGLKTLDSLELMGDSQLTAEGIQKLTGLQNIRRLILPWNTTEPGLKAISSLPRLEEVQLRVTEDRSNEGLAELGRVRNLRRVHVSGAGLSDKSIKFVSLLKGLEELNLRYSRDPKTVRITDAGVAELKGLNTLRVLRLDRLGPMGMAALMSLPNLEHLDIDLYVPAPGATDLSSLHNLKWLRIGGIAGPPSARFRLPVNLERLSIDSAAARKMDFNSCPHLTNLEVDIIADRQAGDLNWLSEVLQLRELALLSQATDRDVKTIAAIASLRALTLQGGCPGPFGDETMKGLRGLPQLESLRIDAPSGTVTDLGMDVLRDLKDLRTLDLSLGNSVTAKGLASIYELKQLRVLRLELSVELRRSLDAVLAHVARLSELEELCIAGSLTDEGLKSLAALKKLRRLDLSGCTGYTDDGLASLMRALPDLQVVKLTYKPITSPGKKK
jgi:hypothetical protein